MRRTTVLLVMLSILSILLLSACGGGVRKRVFPPSASVQELTVQADGQWSLAIRLQNFSNVPQRFTGLDAKLSIGGNAAGDVRPATDIVVSPESVEILELTLQPAADAAAAVRDALESRRSVRYSLDGLIVSAEPDRRRDNFTFDSQLTPVPGLSGVLR